MDFVASDFVALLTLTLMEIILGIDNIIFITIITGRLPEHQRKLGRRVGLMLALVSRIALLATLSFILGLDKPIYSWTKDVGLPESWFAVDENDHGGHFGLHGDAESSNEEDDSANDTSDDANGDSGEADEAIIVDPAFDEVSIRDLILFLGGLFLIGKSVLEIHEKINEGKEEADKPKPKSLGFASVVVQIAIIDIIFSLDSVITAVGMADKLPVMVAAVIIAVVVMLIFAEMVAKFVEAHPTIKMLALSFLILIGVMLVAEGAGTHFDKNYVYFAMAFAVGVEFLNLRARAR